MVKLKCRRCGYEWEYKGKSEWYASCSRCKTSINIKMCVGDSTSRSQLQRAAGGCEAVLEAEESSPPVPREEPIVHEGLRSVLSGPGMPVTAI